MLNNSLSPKNRRVDDVPVKSRDVKGVELPPIISEMPSDYYATTSSAKGGGQTVTTAQSNEERKKFT